MKNFVKKFMVDESGAAAAEYVLILAVIGGGLVAGAVALGDSITNALTSAGSYIEDNDLANRATP